MGEYRENQELGYQEVSIDTFGVNYMYSKQRHPRKLLSFSCNGKENYIATTLQNSTAYHAITARVTQVGKIGPPTLALSRGLYSLPG